MQPIKIWSLFTQSMQAWLDDDASSMGAALAYYTLFSIAPLLLIAIAVAGFFFGQEAARGEIVGQIQQLIGREGAIAVQGMLQSARDPTNGALASAAGLVALVVGATTVFAELQSDLDRIWREQEVNERLEEMMVQSFGDVRDMAAAHKVSYRIAAYMVAIDRVVKAMDLRGWL